MKSFNNRLSGLAMAAVLSGTTVGIFAGDMKSDSKPFAGVMVEKAVVIEQFPSEVQSGSLQVKGDDEQTMAEQARVTVGEAARIATTAVPGKVVEIKLDDENGYLIWEVEVINADAQEVQLKIDAGDGRLLAVEAEDSDDRHEGDREDDERENHGEGKHSSWKFWENDRDEKGGERE